MNALKSFIHFLADGARINSDVSAMRLVVMYGCFISFTGTAVVWLVPMYSTVSIPASAAFGSMATILLSLKLVQNWQEFNEPKKNVES